MKQKGYTLLELLLVVAITGFIVIVVGVSIGEIMRGRYYIAQKSVAIADIDGAAHWLTRDLVLAQTTSLTDGAPATSNMTMNWSDLTAWAADEGSIQHSVNYALSGTHLIRNYDGNQTIIGNYITNAGFSISGNLFTITLTSRPGLPGSTVTRSFAIDERASTGP